MNSHIHWNNTLPTYSPDFANQVIILEAEDSQSRRAILQRWTNEAQQQGATAWFVSCNRHQAGPWAGVNTILSHLFPQIQSTTPNLLIQHDFEWTSILPALRQILPVRHLSLVDEPPLGEPHLTFLPPARMFRVAQGVINLLSTYHELIGSPDWVIIADHYDHSSSLVRYFFAELMRRRGQQMNLTLLLVAEVGKSQPAVDQFTKQNATHLISLDLLTSSMPFESTVTATTPIDSGLTSQIAINALEQAIHLPKSICALQQSEHPEQALAYQIEACALYTRQGFYEDAIEYGEVALAAIERHPVSQQQHWKLLKNLHDCYLAMGQSDLAKQRIETAIASINTPEYLAHAYRNLAMLYTRYHSDKNYETAEACLRQGVDELIRANLPSDEKFYLMLLSDRGLALVRYVQGRLAEAIEISLSLYQRTYERGANKHLPHQALVLSNISRVYAVLKNYEEAICYISDAIAIDPHFSDYYDHRGNLYFRMGYLDDAVTDYLRAIEVSPPYSEAWTNLGQCYRLQGKPVEAVKAYSTSLDLNSSESLALVGRAQAYEMLEQPAAALADYSTALSLDPNQPLILANRAILYYEAENYQEAFDDLNQAIALAPEQSDLYQNRAIVQVTLGHSDDAVRDLTTYLRLNPDADDRSEVEEQLLSLQSGT